MPQPIGRRVVPWCGGVFSFFPQLTTRYPPGVLHQHVAAYTRRPIPAAYLARGCSRGRVSGASRVGHPVDRATYPGRPPVEHVGVDLRGAHVAVPQQLLNGPDVVAVLKQMRREGVAKGRPAGPRPSPCAAARTRADGGAAAGGSPGPCRDASRGTPTATPTLGPRSGTSG